MCISLAPRQRLPAPTETSPNRCKCDLDRAGADCTKLLKINPAPRLRSVAQILFRPRSYPASRSSMSTTFGGPIVVHRLAVSAGFVHSQGSMTVATAKHHS